MKTNNNLLSKYRKFEERFFHSLSSSKRTQYFRRKCLLRWQKRLAALGIVVGIATFPSHAQEVQITRKGPEDRMNTITANDQESSQTVMNNQGQILVAWESRDEEDRDGDMIPDGNFKDIILQRFRWDAGDELLEKVGDEMVINTIIQGSQFQLDMDLNEEGDFVLSWSSYHGNNLADIFMKRFHWDNSNDSLHVLDEEELIVNTHLPDQQTNSKVALNEEGQMVLTWHSYSQVSANSIVDVYARRFNFETGEALDAQEFLVSSPEDGVSSAYPNVTLNEEGDFIIVYPEYEEGRVLAQRYHWGEDNPESVGPPIQVNDHLIENIVSTTQVQMNASGEVLFSYTARNQVNQSYDLYARKYDWLGTIFRPQEQGSFLVTDESNWRHSSTMDEQGNFIIAWSKYEANPNSYAKVFNKQAEALSDELTLNTHVNGTQLYPSVSMDEQGNFMAVWHGSGVDKEGNANVGYDIFGQYFHIDVLATATEDPISRSVRLYPNPGEGVYQIETGLLGGKNISVSVKDILGKVQQESLFNSSDNTLNINALPSGMYLVEFLQGEHKVVKRILKK